MAPHAGFRSDILDFAKTYWYQPCDDHIIYSYVRGTFSVITEKARLKAAGKLPGPDTWYPVFIPEVDAAGKPVNAKERACFIRPNPDGDPLPLPKSPTEPKLSGNFDVVTFHQDHGLVDCAHYVSRCLTHAGKKINQAGVEELVTTLYSRPDTRTLGIKVTRQQGERILNTGIMKPGDVIAYYEREKGNEGYSHSALYMGRSEKNKHSITCHTLSRFMNSHFSHDWNITADPLFLFTLVHFDDDDIFPPSFEDSPWVTIVDQGVSSFYHFLPKGHVERSLKPPINGKAPVAKKADRGYWFIKGFNCFVIWPVPGTVVKIPIMSLPDTDTDGLPITVDDHPARLKTMD